MRKLAALASAVTTACRGDSIVASEKHFVGMRSGVADVVFRRVWRYDSAGVRRERLLDTLAYRIEVP